VHLTALHFAALHYTVLYSTALYCAALYCTIMHCTALHSTAPHCTVLHCTVLYCTVLYRTVLYCTALYCTALCRSNAGCGSHPVCAVALVRPLLGPTQPHTGWTRERERTAERQLLPTPYSPKVPLRYSIEASSRILLLHSRCIGHINEFGKRKV
jgi:hypothetical protein